MNLTNGYDQIIKTVQQTPYWAEMRQKSFDEFQKMNQPRRQDEDWRYINLKPLYDQYFTASISSNNKGSIQTESEIALKLNKNFYNIVFINGYLNSSLSNLNELNRVADIFSFDEILSEKSQIATSILNRFSELSDKYDTTKIDYFNQLNQIFLGQGIILNIKSNQSLDKPIYIHHFIHLEGGLSLADHHRCLISIGENSKVSIYEDFKGQIGARYFSNTLTQILVQKNALIHYLRQQSESEQAIHIGRTKFYLLQNSCLNSLSYQDGGKIGRSNFDVYHIEEGASSKVNGLYLSSKDQIIDNHTHIDHVVGNCNSQQIYKGIVSDQSRAIFNGSVQIRHGALLANSSQLNNNLLLSSEAEIDTKPELKIYADDVKATHGSTIGQLDAEEIFYFQSRGIHKTKAIEMLSYGFMNELVQAVEDIQLLEVIKRQLDKKLKGHS